MSAVKVSSKYQVVIPQDVRQRANIKAGDRIEFVCFGESVYLVPVKPMASYVGCLKGKVRNTFERDEDNGDRLLP